MSLTYAVARVIGRHGRAYTLRREIVAAGPNAWTAGSATVDYYPCRARERRADPKAVEGTARDGASLLIVDPQSLPAGVAPQPGDKIAPGSYTSDAGADWRAVVNVYTPRVADDSGAHRLDVRR